MTHSPTTETVLSANSVVKGFGGQPVLEGVSLSIHEGERVGLIGRNGSGKSTLMKLLVGLETCDDGDIVRRRGLRVGYLTQSCALPLDQTVGDVLEDAYSDVAAMLTRHDELAALLADHESDTPERVSLQEEYSTLHHALEVHGGWDVAQDVKRVSMALNLPDPERTLSTLSGGELRRVDIGATLLSRPDVLLLDEPTNHIDMPSVEWIEKFLRSYQGSLLLVTHDRYFLDLVTTRIVELDGNRLFSFPGNYARFVEYKAQVEEVDRQTEEGRQSTLRRELEWIRRGPKARSTKQKARINRFEELYDQDGPQTAPKLNFQIPTPGRLGKDILEARDLKCVRGGRTLFEDVKITFQKKMIVGVSGPNGCGKSTLARTLMQQDDDFSGKVKVGELTKFLYVDQTHEEVNPEQSVLDFVSGGAHHLEVNDRRMHVPAYLEGMLFDRDSVRSPMGNLSGGERNRMELAKKLLKGGNFLVLDEPTNDLDLQTLRVLEEAILAFDGCSLIISHDRYFLNRVCTHLIVFDEEEFYFSAGNYDNFQIYRSHRTAAKKSSNLVKVPRPQRAPSNRLSYKEKEELKNIESTIEQTEANKLDIESTLNQPGFYEGQHEEVQAVLATLEDTREEITRLYTRWEDLESRKDIK